MYWRGQPCGNEEARAEEGVRLSLTGVLPKIALIQKHWQSWTGEDGFRSCVGSRTDSSHDFLVDRWKDRLQELGHYMGALPLPS